jgi:predicted DsbA family dithiol-disulfide isomerase
MTHEEISPVLAKHAGKVRVVRVHVPLSHIHPHAEDAARAACCAETMGRGDEMAEALFASSSLTRADCEKIAASLGLSSEAFKACLDDPRTKERLDADRATFKAAGGRALPTLFIHRSKIEGARDRAELERTVDEAIRATGS